MVALARPRASGMARRSSGAGDCRTAGCSPSSQNTRQLLPTRSLPPDGGTCSGRAAGLLCGRCYTLARGAQTVCLSVRGREVNCSAGGAGAAVAAARPSVLELEEGGRKGGARAQSFLPPRSVAKPVRVRRVRVRRSRSSSSSSCFSQLTPRMDMYLALFKLSEAVYTDWLDALPPAAVLIVV